MGAQYSILHGQTTTGTQVPVLVTSDGRIRVQGGFGATITGSELTYADLVSNQPAASHSGELWIVETSTGIWLINRKSGGIYRSNGTSWIFISETVDYFDDQNFRIFNTADATKKTAWDSSNITTGNLRTVTMADEDIDLANLAKTNNALVITQDPTGFPNRTDSNISFTDGSLTFTIQPAVTSFDFYISGTKYTKSSAQTKVITDTEGIWYIYFDDSGVIQGTQTWGNDLILKYALIAALYWDATNNKHIYLGDERHAFMPGPTHLNIHLFRGTTYLSGLALGDILVDQDGSLDTHAQLSVANGEILDEDILVSIAADTAPASLPVFYRSGASGDWRADTANNFPVKSFSGGSNRLAWNEFTGGSWQQTEIGQGDFVLSHIFATNDSNKPVIVIQGQDEYGTITAARNGAANELNSLITAGLPFVEFVALGTVIFQTSTSYGNTPQARIRSTSSGGDYEDWRSESLSPSASPGSHADLSGRDAADQHPASSVYTDTTNFDNLLSSADDTTQKALDTLNSTAIFFPIATGDWYDNSTHGDATNSSSTFGCSADVLRAVRFRVEDSYSFDRIAVEKTAGTGTGAFCRLGIYDDNGNRPGDLVFETSQFAFDTNQVYEITISQTLNRGAYWLAVVHGVIANVRTLRAFGNTEGVSIAFANSSTVVKNIMVEVAHTFGALPDPFGTATLSSADKPVRIQLRAL
jgi:hypothetical protein